MKRVPGPKKSREKLPTLRIIGGEWRGRKLPFRAADGLRPTGDRVRETVFNWLQWDIRGARCLDLFAGSGALGFEAASRGAGSVVMVESNSQTAQQLSDNRRSLQAACIDVVNRDAFAYLASSPAPVDIAFVDPPFSLQLVSDSCDRLETCGALQTNALIYVEAPLKQTYTFPQHWKVLRSSRAGQVAATLYQRDNGSA